jgi:UMF1 family MFS transporter
LSRLPRSEPAGDPTKKHLLSNGYKELRKVWGQLTSLPVLKRFLFSFFFYNMGVQTIMLVAALFGKGELDIPSTNLIVAILLVQLIAVPGAFVISKLSASLGNLSTLMLCVVLWVGICIYGYTIPRGDITQFYIISSIIGFVMGGTQSLSRSTYSKLMPVTKTLPPSLVFMMLQKRSHWLLDYFFLGFLQKLLVRKEHLS